MKKIARDKWIHFFVGIPLGAILAYASYYTLPFLPIISTSIAVILLFLICYGFELFSRITGKGHYEIWDAIAGVLGGLLGISIAWIFL